jgi:hypothetical protein
MTGALALALADRISSLTTASASAGGPSLGAALTAPFSYRDRTMNIKRVR